MKQIHNINDDAFYSHKEWGMMHDSDFYVVSVMMSIYILWVLTIVVVFEVLQKSKPECIRQFTLIHLRICTGQQNFWILCTRKKLSLYDLKLYTAIET